MVDVLKMTDDELAEYLFSEEFEKMADDILLAESELEFYVNGDFTTAVETGHAYDGINLILRRYPWVDAMWLRNDRRFISEDKIVAIVKRHEDDEYDEQKGKREAMRKLSRKVILNREKIVARFEEYIARQMKNPAAKKRV